MSTTYQFATTRLGSLLPNIPILGGGRRDPHRTTAAVDPLHLDQRPLLIRLIREPDEAVASALTRDGIRHDLGRLAAGEAGLEKRNQDILIHFGTKVTDEDRVLRATIITRNLLAHHSGNKKI